MTPKCALLAVLPIIVPSLLYAGDSDLDPAFGDGGIASAVIGTTGNSPYTMAVQADGKILSGGICRDNQSSGSYGNDIGIVRFNPDGTLDTTFGDSGKVKTDIGSNHPVYTDERCSGIVVQPDNRIVVAGTTRSYTKTGSNYSFEWYMWDLLLVRYEADGSLDTSFGTDGKVIIDPAGTGTRPEGFNDVALQSDGKIVGAGYTYPGGNQFLVMRFNTDGTTDTSFGAAGTGMVIETFPGNTLQDAYSIAILPDDSMVVAGRGIKSDGNATVSLLKLTKDGLLDTGFNSSGKYVAAIETSSVAQFVTTDDVGRIIVSGKAGGGGTAGANDESAMILRLNPDGTLDTSFNGTGIFTTSYGDFKYETINSVVVQDDGKIFGAGKVAYPSGMVLLRVNEDGTPDETLGPEGKAYVGISGVTDYNIHGTALDADGKLLVGAYMYSTGLVPHSVLRFGGPDPQWNDGYTELADGWQELSWFGKYMPMDGDWIWHKDHEFIHVIADGSAEGLYFHSVDGDWLWTNDVVSPYYYNITTGLWEPDVPTD